MTPACLHLNKSYNICKALLIMNYISTSRVNNLVSYTHADWVVALIQDDASPIILSNLETTSLCGFSNDNPSSLALVLKPSTKRSLMLPLNLVGYTISFLNYIIQFKSPLSLLWQCQYYNLHPCNASALNVLRWIYSLTRKRSLWTCLNPSFSNHYQIADTLTKGHLHALFKKIWDTLSIRQPPTLTAGLC